MLCSYKLLFKVKKIYPYYKVIGCLSVCLWLNNSKTAEPIGLKLIACLLLGPGMVLGKENPDPVTGSLKNRKKRISD